MLERWVVRLNLLVCSALNVTLVVLACYHGIVQRSQVTISRVDFLAGNCEKRLLLTVFNDKVRPEMTITHILFESASGYAIFEAKLSEDIGSKSRAVADSFQDLAKFGKMVSLMSFSPFKSAAQALENINDVSEGS